ncbi:hypothetical protein JVU11DRAFT_9496 [Chiua virens]|nr:hypothetical protein JVU11DRAFT_9496 [Chiua virens]
MITTPTPLHTSRFTLDTSGVSGFFGGDEAISAMITVHVFSAQRWLGWYNIPGSYQIAQRYGLLTRSATFKGLFPGDRIDPTKLFQFDGSQGPKFLAVHSGAIVENTGHLAHVLMKKCVSIDGKRIPGRDGPSVGVTIVKLNRSPPKVVFPKRIFAYSSIFAIIPIFSSLAACAACGVYRDWFSCSLILWGILSHGITSIVIGSGDLYFTHHTLAASFSSGPGDGILGSGTDSELVLLQGEDGAVNAVVRGRFSFKFPNEHYEEYVGCCCILLTIQFLAQLFLIPQGSLFGQIMFLFSLAASWMYILFLSMLDKEKIQQGILLGSNGILMGPSLTRYIFTTRTSAIVFALCVLSPGDPSKIFEEYLPNDSRVWKTWKENITLRFRENRELYFDETDWNLPGYTGSEKRFLRMLYDDAQVAYDGFVGTRVSMSENLVGREWFASGDPQQSIPMFSRGVFPDVRPPPTVRSTVVPRPPYIPRQRPSPTFMASSPVPPLIERSPSSRRRAFIIENRRLFISSNRLFKLFSRLKFIPMNPHQ